MIHAIMLAAWVVATPALFLLAAVFHLALGDVQAAAWLYFSSGMAMTGGIGLFLWAVMRTINHNGTEDG